MNYLILMMLISTIAWGAAKARKMVPALPGMPFSRASLPVQELFPLGDVIPGLLIEIDEYEQANQNIDLRIDAQKKAVIKTESELAAVAKAVEAIQSRTGHAKPIPEPIKNFTRFRRKAHAKRAARKKRLEERTNVLRLPFETLDNNSPENDRSLVEQRYYQKTVNFLEHVQGIIYGKSGSELSKIPREEVQKLVKPLCHLIETEQTQERLRFCGIVLLGKLKTKSGLRTLKLMMDHPSVNLRCAAVGALGRISHPKVGKLVLRALEDENQFVRSASISILGKIEESDSKFRIVPFLGDPSLVVRRSAREVVQSIPLRNWLERLEDFDSKRGLRQLLNILAKTYPDKADDVTQSFLESSKWMVRSCAVNRSLSTRNQNSLPSVMEAIRRTDKELLAELGKIVNYERSIPLSCYGIKDKIRSFDLLPFQQKREELLKLTGNPDSLVRVAAVKALGEMELPEIFEDLSKIIGIENNSFVKSSAISALASLGEKAEPILVGTLKNNDVEVILATIKGLSKAGGISASKSLEPLTRSKNLTIKFFAEQGLDEIKRRRG